MRLKYHKERIAMTTNDVHAVASNNSEIPDDADLRDVLDVFKTMSDPTRMRIILAMQIDRYFQIFFICIASGKNNFYFRIFFP